MTRRYIWDSVNLLLDLLNLSTESVRITVFLTFFCMSAIALVYNDNKKVIKIYLAILILFVITPMLVVSTVWPFYQWTPLNQAGNETQTSYELYIIDDQGTELVYDRRAVPPLTKSPLNSYAKNIGETYNETENQKFANFLVTNACEYRHDIESGNRMSLAFPKGQIDHKWSNETLSNMSNFSGIAVYKTTVTLSPRADVEQKNRTNIKTITTPACK